MLPVQKMMQIIRSEKTLISFAINKKINLQILFRLLLLFAICTCHFNANAQVTKFSGWTAIISTVKLGKKTQIIFDAQLRSNDKIGNLETTIIRPGFAYALNSNNSISIGLALINNRKIITGVTDFVSDNRLWQQWLSNQSLGVNLLQHRIRAEERMIPTIYAEGDELKKRNAKFNARLRYFNRYLSGFKKGVKLKDGPYWVIQNEFFFNAIGAQFANRKFFDQTRTYAGTGWRLSPKSDLEIGYMLQHIEGAGKGYTNNHILQLSSFLRL